MKLNVHIHKIKSIEDLEISLPTEKGLYAITGQNGSGKSTIVACASRAFYRMKMEDYFGKIDPDAYIECELNGIKRKWYKKETPMENKDIWGHSSNGKMEINGFFEGSLIYGNRFKNTSYEKLSKIESVQDSILTPAAEFIRCNLGDILQNDTNFYEKVWYVQGSHIGLSGGYIFFYEKNGKRINQFHMSTGENLLISVLNSIFLRNKDRKSLGKPCMLFLDEIELALHPSSLKKMITFLKDVSEKYNYAIYFSTHSIELISGLIPDNIFYVERHADNSMEVLNPCYPAYATKFLYDHSGYDKVILVEDDLAREIVKRILKKEKMMNNKLIHVLPCGGWTNVLNLADDVVRNNILGKKTSICIILDKDIKDNANKHIASSKLLNAIPIKYLPIESLEKYLRTRLMVNVDHKLFRLLNDYIFQQKSLSDIIQEYKKTKNYNWEKDSNGKTLYKLIDTELRNRNKDRAELIETVVDYLFDINDSGLAETISFLHGQLD